MHIAAIDPGVTTGLVVVNYTPRVSQMTVHVQHAAQHADATAALIVSIIRSLRCRTVVMEQKPKNPSKEGLDNWESIYQRLLTQDYGVSHNMHIDHHSARTIFFVQPSQWKPFMKSRAKDTPFRQHHVADAGRMLHYFLQVNYPEKEINYV